MSVRGRDEIGVYSVRILFPGKLSGCAAGEVRAHTPSPDDVKFGANIFHRIAPNAMDSREKAARGPDLTQGGSRHGVTDEALFRTIPTGSPVRKSGSYFPSNQICR